ncbi:MAG: CARDB domain-containing protein [Vulcanimicrobiota bacterium]
MKRILCLVFLMAGVAWASPLEVVELDWGGDATLGATVEIKAVVQNRSDEVINGAVVVVRSGGQELGQLSDRTRIPPGQKSVLKASFTVPTPLVGQSTERLEARARKYFLPDLSIERVSLPAYLVAGQRSEIVVWVKNDGDDEALAPTVGLRSNGKPVANQTAAQSVGPKRSMPYTLHWVPKETGNLELDIMADPADRLEELDESNNGQHASIEVKADEGDPLLVTSVSLNPSPLRVASPATAQVTVKNRGTLPLARIPLRIYANGEMLKEYIGRERLEPEESRTFLIRWVPKRAGEQTVVVDIDGQPDPKDGRNRKLVEVVDRPAQDLQVTAIDLGSTVMVGKRYKLLVDVANLGELDATTCRVKLLEDGAQREDAVSQAFDLAAGKTARVPVDWIPQRRGKRNLRVVIFSEGVSQERQVENNELVHELEVTGHK